MLCPSFCLGPDGKDVEIEPLKDAKTKSGGGGDAAERHCHFHAGVEYV
jgi:hypothetical protein